MTEKQFKRLLRSERRRFQRDMGDTLKDMGAGAILACFTAHLQRVVAQIQLLERRAARPAPAPKLDAPSVSDCHKAAEKGFRS